MKSRGLFIALIVLAALAGLLYWSNRQSAAKTSEAASAVPPSPKILALNQADIVKVELKKKDANDVVLAKNNSGVWQITSPREFSADQGTVSSLLSSLSTLNADRVLEEKGGDLGSYGLAPAVAEVTITENGNKSHQLLIGEDTPTHDGAYAALQGDPRIFTIASYNKTSLDKSLNDLRDKRFLTVESDKVNRLELLGKNSDLEFDHYKDHWQIVKPKPLRADGTPIEDFIRNLVDAKIDLSQSAEEKDKAASSFKKAETVGTVKVTSETATQELNVRKLGKEYYAKSSLLDAAYKISDQIGQEFSKTLDDFRNKKLFDFGYTDPAKIEIKAGAKSYAFTKKGEDWLGTDGKKMELTQFYSFLDKVRELKADKFVESGFASPAIEITVTPSSGQAEKVSLAKNGDAYVAKRENDSSLYQLDGKTIEALEKAAGDVKPASEVI